MIFDNDQIEWDFKGRCGVFGRSLTITINKDEKRHMLDVNVTEACPECVNNAISDYIQE